jgi:hypothetical protein
MHVRVLSGPPGCGKTLTLLKELIDRPGRYLLASPRIDLIEERERDLKSMIEAKLSDEASFTAPIIRKIHGGRPRSAPVARQITEAIEKYRGDDHVILLITHEGMMSAYLGDLTRWRVGIDEIPLGVATDKIGVEAGTLYLQQSYDLCPVPGTNVSKLKVRDDAPGTCSVLRDSLMKEVVTLDKRARTAQGVYVDVQDWADLRERGRKLQWWSAWTPLQLQSAESVTIAGAGYQHSILAKVTEALHPGQIEIEEVCIPGRPRQPRRISIHYFTRGHRGSSAFWKDKGRDCLLKVSLYLEAVLIGYWSGNEVVTDYLYGRLRGEKVSPKAEGTNDLMHHTSCAYIYSSKALPSDAPLIDVLKLKSKDIERAREIEDIIQFVCRGDLRNPNATGDYDIYLYDLCQAQALADYLTEHGFGMVELVPVEEAGLLDVRRPGRGRPPSDPEAPRSREERLEKKRADDAERQRRRQERLRKEKKDNGTYRSRGRPPKSLPPEAPRP